ncbi:MAG: hypothetical protein GTO54_11655 [Nitrososphaeria archaeon]|nr:hypothetical protein [Nitrososphaeria archaeon]
MPTAVKEMIHDFIPGELIDKIATEEDVTTIDETKKFLEENGHPIVERWKAIPEVAVETEAESEKLEPQMELPQIPSLPLTYGGFKIVLKDAKISAKRMVIKRVKGRGGSGGGGD